MWIFSCQFFHRWACSVGKSPYNTWKDILPGSLVEGSATGTGDLRESKKLGEAGRAVAARWHGAVDADDELEGEGDDVQDSLYGTSGSETAAREIYGARGVEYCNLGDADEGDEDV